MYNMIIYIHMYEVCSSDTYCRKDVSDFLFCERLVQLVGMNRSNQDKISLSKYYSKYYPAVSFRYLTINREIIF